ncbi:MAG: hypothetical protein F7C34_02635, partial [Desulfurococcales archaeon]|nr:hypothetical protein [Desulfurococcales archaeon]
AMLPMTTLFMVVSPILLITGITILSMGILYRIREQIIVSSGLILLGLGFVAGVLGLSRMDETLMIEYGWKYPFVKLLEAGILNPLKGPVSPSFVQLGSWTPYAGYMIASNVFIILGIILLSYVGSLMVGLDEKKALIVPVIVAILGFAGVALLDKSISLMAVGHDIPGALSTRDTSAYLRTSALLLGFIVLTIGAMIIYFETKGREYMIYSISYFLLGLAWALISTSFFTGFERRAVLQFIVEGSVSTPLRYFTAGAILMVLGSVGLLIASTIEVVGSALGGAEELEAEEAAAE